MAFNASHTTTDPDVIRSWAAQRGAVPVQRSSSNSINPAEDAAPHLGFHFRDDTMAHGMTQLDWDAFFQVFEAANLALVYEDSTESGELSHDYQLVDRG